MEVAPVGGGAPMPFRRTAQMARLLADRRRHAVHGRPSRRLPQHVARLVEPPERFEIGLRPRYLPLRILGALSVYDGGKLHWLSGCRYLKGRSEEARLPTCLEARPFCMYEEQLLQDEVTEHHRLPSRIDNGTNHEPLSKEEGRRFRCSFLHLAASLRGGCRVFCT